MTVVKRKILLVVNTSTFFTEMFRVAQIIKNSNKFEPILILYTYPTVQRDLSRCKNTDIKCYLKTDLLNVSSSLILINKFKKIINYILLKVFRRHAEIFSFIDIFNERKEVKIILLTINPSLIILGGDMVGYDTSFYIQIAHRNKIKAIVIPSTMSNGLEQAEAYYLNERYLCNTPLKKIFCKFYPKWVRVHKGRNIMREFIGRIVAMELLRVSPPLPWIFNSGYSDIIGSESEAMIDYYADCGIPREQFFLTGSPADDVLYNGLNNKEVLKEKLYKKFKFNQDKPLLLSALPPDSLYFKGGRPECDFNSYNEIVEFWIKSISNANNFNILVCLHPAVNFNDFKYIENFGVSLAKENTADLIPLSDLYVASVSSTIRWAIACGVPVLNYDIYKYRYTDFLEVEGVITIEKNNDYLSILDRMNNDMDYLSEMTKKQKSCAKYWGNIDGLSGSRILSLIERMIGEIKT
jgi:hypothetical protein